MNKVEVDQETCIGCGLCTQICPEVFSINSNGKSESIAEVEEQEKTNVDEAINSCPVEAIAWA